MTTKGPSHKQIIVSMGSKNINKFIASSGNHITNLNIKNSRIPETSQFI